jgi:hypothetical protein
MGMLDHDIYCVRDINTGEKFDLRFAESRHISSSLAGNFAKLPDGQRNCSIFLEESTFEPIQYLQIDDRTFQKCTKNGNMA